MAEQRRRIKEIIQEARENVASVANSAKPALNGDELFKMDKTLVLLDQLENVIERVKEEFIRTINECSP